MWTKLSKLLNIPLLEYYAVGKDNLRQFLKRETFIENQDKQETIMGTKENS